MERFSLKEMIRSGGSPNPEVIWIQESLEGFFTNTYPTELVLMLSRKHLFLDPGNQLMGGFSFSKSMEVLTTSKGFISETE